MWPTEPPKLPGFRFASCNYECAQPVHEIGWLNLSDDTLALWVIQSSDSHVRATLSHHLKMSLPTDDPRALLNFLNRLFSGGNHFHERFALVLVMIVRSSDHTLSVASAGLSCPMLRTAD